jgi:tetratricopeptide (TPR) repeat protein
MIAEQHYDDETLIALAESAATTDAHLSVCQSCAEAVEELRRIPPALASEAVWSDRPLPESPRPSTVATLRSIATQMDGEDADAERHITALLDGPRETWKRNLEANPAARTPGTVRRLIAATDRAIDTAPADAVEITGLAVDIAERLEAATWYGDTIPRLRGAAWRERAYALFYVGRHVEALTATDIAASWTSRVVVAEFDEARLMLVRALVLRALERYDEALRAADGTTVVFSRFGDTTRVQYAAMFSSTVAYSKRDYRRAAQLFEQLADFVSSSGDSRSLASVKQNLAACYRELGDSELALRCFGEAITLFERLGMDAERVRATWHVGRVLLAEAKYADAASVFCAVKDNYARLQIVDKAAIAAVDLAEASLMLGRLADVIEACRYAVTFYQASGLAYTENALTALAMIREAATAGRLTSFDVARVRSYLERLPTQPQLLFARSPE